MSSKTIILLFSFLFFGLTGYASFPTEKKVLKTETTQKFEKSSDAESAKAVDNETIEDGLASPAAGGKSQLVALLLAIFLGGLGIHRFYLGYTTIGIIQLLTAGGCGIWALIDIIRIAIGDLQPKNGSYSDTL